MSLRTIIEFGSALPDGSPCGVLVAHELDRPFEDVRVTAEGSLVSVGLHEETAHVKICYTGFIHLADGSRTYLAMFDRGELTAIREGGLEAFAPADLEPSAVLDLLRMAFAEKRDPPPHSVRALLALVGNMAVTEK